MIINRPGAEFYHEGIKYVIGETFVGTDESEYAGLYGRITEIRDGDDKETENETPDIYCDFEPPVLPCQVEELEAVFSDLYGEPKKLEDICLDCVIMAPEMIKAIPGKPEATPGCKVYVVMEDWAANDEQGTSLSTAFTEKEDALYHMFLVLKHEMESGCIADWKDNENFTEDSTAFSYECYIEGFYCSEHYSISVVDLGINASLRFTRELGEVHKAACQLEDFASQIEPWEEIQELTDEQYEKLIHDSRFPELLQKALGKNDYYWEAYWETVSEVAHELVKAYIKENTHSDSSCSEEGASE